MDIKGEIHTNTIIVGDFKPLKHQCIDLIDRKTNKQKTKQ